jgi:hypothetical protein
VNRRIAEAVIATFRPSVGGHHYARLSTFTYHDWLESYAWLDASGLALYFLERIKSLHIERAIPLRVVERLKKNLSDNRMRIVDMFEEFIRINNEFRRAGFSYVNLKGFALVPDAYADPFLRCQLDLDFLMARSDALRCQTVLAGLGYVLTGIDADVWEYKAGVGQPPSVRNLYKPKPQRCLEVHFITSKEQSGLYRSYDLLSRSQRHTWNGFDFPVLSECDKFVAQAAHLFKHLRSEWTRISWILEYATYVRTHRTDDEFWRKIYRKISMDPESKVAVGTATLMASHAFGLEPPDLAARTVQELPESIRLWIEHYSGNVLMAEFPGTKLYLLLQKGLSQDVAGRGRERRGKLFPIHRPPRVVHPSEGDGLWQWLAGLFVQVRFIWFRLRFHSVQGIHYMVEAPRWKRILAGRRPRKAYL